MEMELQQNIIVIKFILSMQQRTRKRKWAEMKTSWAETKIRCINKSDTQVVPM